MRLRKRTQKRKNKVRASGNKWKAKPAKRSFSIITKN